MPLVYGKTKHSATSDILNELRFILKKNETYKIANVFYEFWENRFPAINNLMTLVNEVGWFASYFNKPVRYQNHYLTTIQDYMVKNNIHLYVYDWKRKKRKKITLIVPTETRDRAKTLRSAQPTAVWGPQKCDASDGDTTENPKRVSVPVPVPPIVPCSPSLAPLSSPPPSIFGLCASCRASIL
jgi:hypothetical protein